MDRDLGVKTESWHQLLADLQEGAQLLPRHLAIGLRRLRHHPLEPRNELGRLLFGGAVQDEQHFRHAVGEHGPIENLSPELGTSGSEVPV